jgi:hypothetical protein
MVSDNLISYLEFKEVMGKEHSEVKKSLLRLNKNELEELKLLLEVESFEKDKV